MLQPKKTKYSAYRKARASSLVEVKYTVPVVGSCALKSLSSGRLSARQIKAMLDVSRKIFKKYGKVWVVVFPDRSVSAKSASSRMGKGKGAHSEWVCLVKKGRILLEVEVPTLPQYLVKKLLRKVQEKISLKTVVVFRKC